jgi:hypothetical protein
MSNQKDSGTFLAANVADGGRMPGRRFVSVNQEPASTNTKEKHVR